MNGYTRAAPRQFDRNKQLQLLAIAKTQLGWDEEFYRGIWLPERGATKDEDGRYSANTLSNTQLFKAVEEVKRLGFKVQSKNAAKKPRKGHRKQADDDQSKMIRGLWIELHELGAVRDPSEAALAKFVSGQMKSSEGVEALQWLDSSQASRIIEQLKKWRARVNAVEAQNLASLPGAPVEAGRGEPVDSVRGEPVEP